MALTETNSLLPKPVLLNVRPPELAEAAIPVRSVKLLMAVAMVAVVVLPVNPKISVPWEPWISIVTLLPCARLPLAERPLAPPSGMNSEAV